MFLEIDEHCACIDGMTSVRQVVPFARIFEKGNIYHGGICLHYDDYPLEDIRKKIRDAGHDLPEVDVRG